MTVARVRQRAGADSVDVMFLESARIYKVPKAHPRVQAILDKLTDAMSQHRAVMVTLASHASDVIQDVTPR